MKQRELRVGDRVRVYMPGYQPKDGYIKEKYLGPYYIARVVIDKEYGEERDWQVYPQQCRRLKKKPREYYLGISKSSGYINIVSPIEQPKPSPEFYKEIIIVREVLDE